MLLLGGCVYANESLAETNKRTSEHRTPTYGDGFKSINKVRRTVGQGEAKCSADCTLCECACKRGTAIHLLRLVGRSGDLLSLLEVDL